MALDLGFIISFAGNITFPKAQNIREAASMVPLDRMFIEELTAHTLRQHPIAVSAMNPPS